MQSNAADKAQKQAQQQFLMQRNDLGPYREAGLAPLQAQQALLGLQGQPAADAAMANFQQSPGYQWQLDQGLRAVDAGAAAKGMLRSGATLQAEQQFGQGLANTDFSNYYARLMDMTKLGETAAAGGAANAGNAADAALKGANAQSSIYGNTASALGGSANMLLNNKGFQDWLGGGVSQTDVSNNALYQQGAFAAAGPGAYGPFK
ncbi:MAG TPA: hypothetical protein VL522_23335 [Bordetella sp.]|jgi:hypothetical protein|nr:hypothetical protein [Bordetella sp.]